ncbi:hypothetical protein L6R49_25765 [Myxococcota bacterium]|nr:hypothetical protein [Myxococcota bacterium]
MRVDPTTTDADRDIDAPPPTEMAVSALLGGLGAAPVLAVLGFIPIPGLMFFSPVAIGVGVGLLSRGRAQSAVLKALLPGLLTYTMVSAGVMAFQAAAQAEVQPPLEMLWGLMVGSLMCGGVINGALAVPAAIITSKV